MIKYLSMKTSPTEYFGNLSLLLDLEADLGVDTVKQAEILAAVREKYGLPRDEKFRLADFPRLRDLVAYVVKRIETVGAARVAAAPAAAAPAAPVSSDHAEAMEEAVDELRASEEALAGMLDGTLTDDQRDMLRAVLESVREARGYLTGREVEAETELPGEVESAASEES